MICVHFIFETFATSTIYFCDYTIMYFSLIEDMGKRCMYIIWNMWKGCDICTFYDVHIREHKEETYVQKEHVEVIPGIS